MSDCLDMLVLWFIVLVNTGFFKHQGLSGRGVMDDRILFFFSVIDSFSSTPCSLIHEMLPPRAFPTVSVSFSLLTSDGNFGWPFGGPIQDTLLHCFHLLHVGNFAHCEDISDNLKDLWFIPFSNLHTVLHSHNNVLRPVLSSMFRALFSSPWRMAQKAELSNRLPPRSRSSQEEVLGRGMK